MQLAMHIATSDRETKHKLKSNSRYRGVENVALDNFNTTYYQLHPFIFERLPSLF
jgi:hypothetical protein